MELFRDLVRTAMANRRVVSTEMTEFYLVNLLEKFVRPEDPLLDRPLGIQYLRALQAPVRERYGALKRIGDTSLFVSGVFVASLERRLVGPEYYASVGRLAYTHLSTLAAPSGTALTGVFGELASRFPSFAAVLAEIAFETFARSDLDTLRVYQRWCCTRSHRDAELLMRRGLIPVAPNDRNRH